MKKESTCSNVHPCSCPYNDCENHGKCCDCVMHHKELGNTPNCFSKPE